MYGNTNKCTVTSPAARIEIGGSETRCPSRCKYCQDYGAISGNWNRDELHTEPCTCQDFWGLGGEGDAEGCVD